MEDKKEVLKIATRVQTTLAELQFQRWYKPTDMLTTFEAKHSEFGDTTRKLKKALNKGWFIAAETLRKRMDSILNDLSYTIQLLKQQMSCPNIRVPKLSTLFAEIEQIEQDCGDICYDSERDTISLQTEAINLEDLYLGPFRIELHLNKLPELYKGTPYYCIAIEPNYPATTDEVTHPHVSNNILCEGDGSVTIRAALEEGRLCDFFSIVTNILKTYNPDSPYVSIYDWSGVACYDCGYICDSESYYYCPSCEHNFCESCSSYCQVCDETICLGCGGECPNCGDFVCSGCMKECSKCGFLCCESCLEENKCPNCIEEESENDNEETEQQEQENKGIETSEKQSQSAQACTAIQPHSVGETVVLQRQIR